MIKTADFINSLGPSKKTPLHFAVEGDSIACVRAIVEDGQADINVRDSKSRTPLFIACEKGNLEIV